MEGEIWYRGGRRRDVCKVRGEQKRRVVTKTQKRLISTGRRSLLDPAAGWSSSTVERRYR